MIATVTLLLFALLGAAGLAAMAIRTHRSELQGRAALLDGLSSHFDGSRIEIGSDGFPTLTAVLADRRQVTISLLPDTLVMRRLPQLWLVVTLRERVEKPRPSIGALARPTGAEFYSRVLKFPARIETPAGLDPALLLRSDRRLLPTDLARIAAVLGSIFHDPCVKEIAATPRGVRVVRQASEGERGAHLLLRQVRFPMRRLDPDLVARSIADADALREALDALGAYPMKLSA